MKRRMIVMLMAIVMLVSVTVSVGAKNLVLDNNGFEINEESREGEIHFGWKHFVAGNTNTSITAEEAAEGKQSLKMIGIDGTYVGVRSVHVPVTAGKTYTVSVKALLREMGNPSGFRIYMEFWPEGYEAETSAWRLAYPRAQGDVVGKWSTLSVTDMAPANAASLSVLIFFNKVSGLAYVDDVQVIEH
jgi:hypothetical protein